MLFDAFLARVTDAPPRAHTCDLVSDPFLSVRASGPAASCGGPHMLPTRLGRVVLRRCYSCAFTAFADACLSVPLRIAVLCPAAAGMPSLALIKGSMRNEKIPPHPLAPGAANELLTREFLLIVRILPSGLLSSVPALPLICLFGSGGLVVSVVKLMTTVLAFEPM